VALDDEEDVYNLDESPDEVQTLLFLPATGFPDSICSGLLSEHITSLLILDLPDPVVANSDGEKKNFAIVMSGFYQSFPSAINGGGGHGGRDQC